MKNLQVERESTVLLPSCSRDASEGFEFCVAASEGRLFIASAGGSVACVALSTYEVEWAVSWAEVVRSASPGRPVSAAYLLEQDCLCVGLSNGSIVVVSPESRTIEEVGCVDGGLLALQWSPDGEVAALVTGAGRLLMMSKDWDVLSEEAMVPDGAEAAVAVGQLSWRGDAKFCASALQLASGGCHVAVWDRETGRLHSRADKLEGLQPVLAWQPNGRHVYVAARSPPPPPLGADGNSRSTTVTSSSSSPSSLSCSSLHGGQCVFLYERNGLQHGGFDITGTAGVHKHDRVTTLAWSADSELLAVVLEPSASHSLTQTDSGPPTLPRSGDGSGNDGGSSQAKVQVWHRSNWHWYLKYERRWAAASSGHEETSYARRQLAVQWDERQPLCLHIVAVRGTTGGGRGDGDDSMQYSKMSFAWDVCTSTLGTAVVVDGPQLLLTPLRHVLIPPPMAAAAASLQAPATAVAVCSSSEREQVAALMSDGGLALLVSVEDDLWEETADEQHHHHQQQSGAGSAAPSSSTNRAAGRPDTSLQYGADKRLAALTVATDVPLGAGRLVRALAWAGDSCLLAVASPYPEPGLEDGPGDVLVAVQLDLTWPAAEEDQELPAAASAREVAMLYAGEPVQAVASCPDDGGNVLVQLASGRLLVFDAQSLSLTPASGCKQLPAPCRWMQATPAAALRALGRGVPPAVALSARGQLFWGTALIADDVTSAAIRADGPGGGALLYTTRSHLLYTAMFGQLQRGYAHRNVSDREVAATQRDIDRLHQHEVKAAMYSAMRPSAATAAVRDVAVRAIEQGAVLVAAPAGAVSAVLQMPRGNLEGVQPRVLVLTAIALALQRQQHAEAWRLATAHRVDLNLIVDYQWPAFLSHCTDFVAAVPAPSDLCDLLAALRPGSITTDSGLYANAIPQLPIAAAAGAGAAPPLDTLAAAGGPPLDELLAAGKVNAVCRALREAAHAAGASKYLNVIVTSFARSEPPQLAAALVAIREAKEQALSSSSSGVGASADDGSSPADKALKHLLLTVDAEEAYRTALEMYDLPLAYMVVVHAQRDPGEALQELRRFGSVAGGPGGPLARHHIDMHLQRYDSALRHLVAAGLTQHFDAALRLARDKGLLRLLLQLVEKEPPLRLQVLQALGESLEGQQKFEDAALSFVAAGQLARALTAYRSAGNWRMVLSLAARQGRDADAVRRLARELVDDLSSSGQLADAGLLTVQYMGDADNGVALLAGARAWQEAVRVAYQHGRADLVETVVAPAAAEAATSLLSEAQEACERIVKYSARLVEVRRKREAMEVALAAAAAEEGGTAEDFRDEVADAASEAAASTVGGLSVYTDHTHVGGATTANSGSRVPSTLGGRKPHKGAKKNVKKGRIRAGSPGEEHSLVAHITGLAPTAAVCREGGQMCELLVLLGHLDDAQKVQQQLSAWQVAHDQAMDDIKAHPLPPLPGDKLQPAAPLVPPPSACDAASSGTQWKWDILRR